MTNLEKIESYTKDEVIAHYDNFVEINSTGELLALLNRRLYFAYRLGIDPIREMRISQLIEEIKTVSRMSDYNILG